MSFKLVLNDEIKRVPGVPASFASLKETITKTFGEVLNENFAIKYQDADKDWITVNSEEDFQIMMELAPKSIPKIHIFPVGASMSGSQIIKEMSISQPMEAPKVSEIPEISEVDPAEVEKVEKAAAIKSLRRALLLLKRDIVNHKIQILTFESQKNTIKGDSLLNNAMTKHQRDQSNNLKIQIQLAKFGLKGLKKDVAALEGKIQELSGVEPKVKEPKVVKIDEGALDMEVAEANSLSDPKGKFIAKKEKKARITEIEEYLCVLSEKKIRVSMKILHIKLRTINGEIARIESELSEEQLAMLENQMAELKKEKETLKSEEYDLKVEIATLKARLDRVKGSNPAQKEKLWDSEELNGKSKQEVEQWLRLKLREEIDGKIARENQIRTLKLEIAQFKQEKVGIARQIVEIKSRKAKLYKESVNTKSGQVKERLQWEMAELKEGIRKMKEGRVAIKAQIQTLKHQIREIKGSALPKVQLNQEDHSNGLEKLIDQISPAVKKFFSKENLGKFPELVKEFASKIMGTFSENKEEAVAQPEPVVAEQKPEEVAAPVEPEPKQEEKVEVVAPVEEVKAEEKKPEEAEKPKLEEIPTLEEKVEDKVEEKFEVPESHKDRVKAFHEMFPSFNEKFILETLELYSYKTDEEMLEVFLSKF